MGLRPGTKTSSSRFLLGAGSDPNQSLVVTDPVTSTGVVPSPVLPMSRALRVRVPDGRHSARPRSRQAADGGEQVAQAILPLAHL